MYSILLLASLVCSCTCDGIYDLDTAMNSAEECLWHAICDLDKAIELKPVIDALLDQTIVALCEELKPKANVLLRKNCAVECIRSKEMWENDVKEIFCVHLTEEERANFTNAFEETYFTYQSEHCFNRESEICEALSECLKIYQLFNAKMVEKEECFIEGINFKPEDPLGGFPSGI